MGNVLKGTPIKSRVGARDVRGLNLKWNASVAEKLLTLRRGRGEDEPGDMVRAASELKVNKCDRGFVVNYPLRAQTLGHKAM